MSFKGLNDSFKRAALPHFLNASDSISGLLVNIVISKNVSNLIHAERLFEVFSSLNLLKHKWNRDAFGKVSLLSHFIAVLIAGVAKENQHIYWYSDEDNLFANQIVTNDVLEIMARFTELYKKVNLGELGIGTTKLNEPDFLEEDINSIPDLAAGALADFFDKIHELVDKCQIKDFAYLFPKDISPKTYSILEWLSKSQQQLKKVTVVFDRANDSGGYKIWRFDVRDQNI